MGIQPKGLSGTVWGKKREKPQKSCPKKAEKKHANLRVRSGGEGQMRFLVPEKIENDLERLLTTDFRGGKSGERGAGKGKMGRKKKNARKNCARLGEVGPRKERLKAGGARKSPRKRIPG